ncbi:MAG: hypothetical protein ACLFM7_00540 [Bacteroidales bacterium]
MKMHFSELFEIQNKLVRPKVTVEIGGIKLEQGKSYGDGASSAGVNLIKHRDSYFDVVKEDNNVYKIKTIYD